MKNSKKFKEWTWFDISMDKLLMIFRCHRDRCLDNIKDENEINKLNSKRNKEKIKNDKKAKRNS